MHSKIHGKSMHIGVHRDATRYRQTQTDEQTDTDRHRQTQRDTNKHRQK